MKGNGRNHSKKKRLISRLFSVLTAVTVSCSMVVQTMAQDPQTVYASEEAQSAVQSETPLQEPALPAAEDENANSAEQPEEEPKADSSALEKSEDPSSAASDQTAENQDKQKPDVADDDSKETDAGEKNKPADPADSQQKDSQTEADPKADIETAAMWEAVMANALTLPSGANKAVAIALRQIGYRQSEKNFQTDPSGIKTFYTRYGQWAGVPYRADWQTDFLRFVYTYAGASKTRLSNGETIAQWAAQAKASGWLQTDYSELKKGDLLFFSLSDGLHGGVVTSISGNVTYAVTRQDQSVSAVSIVLTSPQPTGYYPVFERASKAESSTEQSSEQDAPEAEEAKPAPVKPAETGGSSLSCQKNYNIAPNVTGATFQYQRAGTDSWETITDDVQLHYDDQVRISVNYRDLKKSEIEKASGRVYFDLPYFVLMSSARTPILYKGSGDTEINLGEYYGCQENGAGHVHLDMIHYDDLPGDIEEGTFFIQGGLDVVALSGKNEETVTIGSDSQTFHFENIKPEIYGTLDIDKTWNLIKDETGVYHVYRLIVTTGEYDVPNVFVDDRMTANHWAFTSVPGSLTIRKGGKEAAIDDLPETQINTADSAHFYDNGKSGAAISHSFGSENKVSHSVPARGFTYYTESLEANSQLVIEYKVQAKTDQLQGGQFTTKNEASAWIGSVKKSQDVVANVLNAEPNINKTAARPVTLPDGNLRIDYTIAVSLSEHSSYPYADFWLDDELSLYEEANSSSSRYAEYLKYISLDHDSVKLDGAVLSEENIHDMLNEFTGSNGTTDRGMQEIRNDSEIGNNRKKKGYRFFLGDFLPGQSKTLKYSIVIDQELFLALAADGREDVQLGNYACTRRITENDNGQGYSFEKGSNYSFMQMSQAKLLHKTTGSTVQSDTEISMAGAYAIYNADGSAAAGTSSFTVPRGAVAYTVTTNQGGLINVDSATMSDQLSENGKTDNLHMAYTGYIRVDVMPNDGFVYSDTASPVCTFFIKAPEDATEFSFTPQNYAAVSDHAKSEAPYYAYRLAYYTKPVNADELLIPVLVKNDVMADYTFGVAGEIRNVSMKSSVTVTQSGESHLGAKKAGVMVLEQEQDKGTKWENGRVIWLVQIDASSIPEQMTFTDIIKDSGVSSGSSEGVVSGGTGQILYEDSLIGAYKAGELFGKNLEQINAGSSGYAKITYDQLLSTLGANGQRLDSSYYSTALDGDQKLNITFNKGVNLKENGEQKYLYLLIQAASEREQPFLKGDEFGSGPKATNNHFANGFTSKYKDQDETELVDKAGLVWRHTNTTYKFWSAGFVWKDSSVIAVSRNKDQDAILGAISDEQWSSLFNERYGTGGSISLRENSYYSHWTIVNNCRAAEDGGYRSHYTGDFTFVETLPEDSEFVDAFVTGSGLSATGTCRIVNVQTDPASPRRVVITVRSDNEDQFNLHIVTRYTGDWAELIANSDTPIEETNFVEVYNNGSQIGEAKADHDLIVDGVLSKESVKTEGDASLNGTGSLDYEIRLNEAGVDLIEGGDTLTLTDSFDRNALEILLDTIKVVNSTTDEIIPAGVSITDAEGNATRVLQIGPVPDDQPITITYTARLSGKPGDSVTVSNSVSWTGTGKSAAEREDQTHYNFQLSAIASGAIQHFKLTKFDGSDASNRLPGASYALYRYDFKDGKIQSELVHEWTTDKDGVIANSDSDHPLEKDIVYGLVETKAPEGYQTETEAHYFLFTSPNTDTAGITEKFSTLTQSILFVPGGNLAEIQAIDFPNPVKITIHKTFTDTPAPGTYRFGLYEEAWTEGSSIQPVSTAQLVVASGSEEKEASLEFEGLSRTKTYFIYELDETGTPVLNNETLQIGGVSYTVSYPDGNTVSMGNAQNDNVSLHIANAAPASLIIEKSFVPSVRAGRYSFGVFTEPYGEGKTMTPVATAELVVDADGGNTQSVTITGLALDTDYYVYELDSRGQPVPAGATVSTDQDSFVVTYPGGAKITTPSAGDEVHTVRFALTNTLAPVRLQIHKTFSDKPKPGTYRFGLYENEWNAEQPVQPQKTADLHIEEGSAAADSTEAVVEFDDLDKDAAYFVYELDSNGNPVLNGSQADFDSGIYMVTYPDGNAVDLSNASPESGNTISFAITNTEVIPVHLRIEKTFTETPAPGTYSFGVYENEWNTQQPADPVQKAELVIAENTQNTEASVEIEGLKANHTYYVYELDPITGLPAEDGSAVKVGNTEYRVTYPDGNAVELSSATSDHTVSFAITNSAVIPVGLRIEKTFTETPAPGTYTFGVYEAEWNAEQPIEPVQKAELVIAEDTQDTEASVEIGGLEPDRTYYVYELDPKTGLPAADGSVLEVGGTDYRVFYPAGNEAEPSETDPDSHTLSIPVKNAAVKPLPRTGDSGTDWIYGAGILALLGAAAVFEQKRRRLTQK